MLSGMKSTSKHGFSCSRPGCRMPERPQPRCGGAAPTTQSALPRSTSGARFGDVEAPEPRRPGFRPAGRRATTRGRTGCGRAAAWRRSSSRRGTGPVPGTGRGPGRGRASRRHRCREADDGQLVEEVGVRLAQAEGHGAGTSSVTMPAGEVAARAVAACTRSAPTPVEMARPRRDGRKSRSIAAPEVGRPDEPAVGVHGSPAADGTRRSCRRRVGDGSARARSGTSRSRAGPERRLERDQRVVGEPRQERVD